MVRVNDGSVAVSGTRDSGVSPEWGISVALRSVLVACVGLVVSMWVSRADTWGEWGSLVASLVLWGALLTAVVWAVTRHGSGVFRVDLGLAFRSIDIVIALLFGIALRSIAMIAEMVAMGLTAPQLPGLVLFDGGLAPEIWLMLIVVPILVAPLVEELFFHGVLQPAIAQSIFRKRHRLRAISNCVAVIVTAALFACGHLVMNPSPYPFLMGSITFALGVVCGGLTIVTGRLGPAIATHLVFNVSGVALLIMGTFG